MDLHRIFDGFCKLQKIYFDSYNRQVIVFIIINVTKKKK